MQPKFTSWGIFLQGVLNTVFTALVFSKCSQFTFEVAMQIAAFEIMALYLWLSKAPTQFYIQLLYKPDVIT